MTWHGRGGDVTTVWVVPAFDVICQMNFFAAYDISVPEDECIQA